MTKPDPRTPCVFQLNSPGSSAKHGFLFPLRDLSAALMAKCGRLHGLQVVIAGALVAMG